jgi:hypothetical protein
MALSVNDGSFAVPASILDAPQSIACLLILTQCFRSAYESAATTAPRFGDLATACASIARLIERELPDDNLLTDTVVITADSWIGAFEWSSRRGQVGGV